MAKAENASCPNLYRKPGKDTVHCKAMTDKGARWDFCKYQYFCRASNRYETTKDAATCSVAQN